MMLFISRQYSRSDARAGGQPGPRRRARRTARSGSSCPIPGLNRAVVQAVNVGALDQRRRPRGLHHRRPGGGGAPCATDFERQMPGRPARRRRVAVPRPGRPAARLPRRARRGLAAGQARRRSRSWSSPSTWPAAGGSGSSTTSRRSGCGRCCSAGRTRSSSTCRTGARTRDAVRAPAMPRTADEPRSSRAAPVVS